MKRSLFINSNDRLFMRVRPFTGKYAAKKSNFFECMSDIQKQKMPDHWVYRPINSEIEITSCCNQSCPHCGMAANRHNGVHYQQEQLIDYIHQLHDNGIISFSLTGGEPFLDFSSMLCMMEAARSRVDIAKITSNGFWGKSPAYYFEKMVNAGLLSNSHLVPCLMISIGEQSTPMQDVCAIFHYAVTHFSAQELTLCISSLCEYGQDSKVDEFINTYKTLFGDIPPDRIFLTENYYRNSKYIQQATTDVEGRNVANYMMGPVRCFEPTIGKYILPRLLVKANGDVCTCACFNPPEQLYIGNYRKSNLREILEQINSSDIVRIIAKDGLHQFRHWISLDECRDINCNNECDACRYLINSYLNLKK